ncbi:MAG TPA: FGGY-family carbohydrate kinase [Oscillospiraceae bacterium]|nr:FGGY-family carbohydrate kinase [Oscillospiraceae bacterium]
MNIASQIQEGKTSIGIELGSTRVKAVLIGEDYSPIASGAYDWENHLEQGIWTYSLDDVWQAMQLCFKNLSDNVREKYGVQLETAASIGISAMMHGYLAFDKNDKLLVPFRTWRNTMTEEAAAVLTDSFEFNIPQRWSIAHLYQAILNDESHVSELSFFTTLAGYVHWQLTGEKVLGIGDASGMFPIDPDTKDYNARMAEKFSELTADRGFRWELPDVLPKIIGVGECAGKLTEQGAILLDPTGTLKAGISFCPPEGDAQTGMAATNSIAPKTGNVSAGTSIFAMAVLEQDLSSVHKEIDIVTTPCGSPVAMVHCNNCTTDLDAWVRMLGDTLKLFGLDIPKPQLYDKLYEAALSGKPDCGGLLTYNYYSGEHVTGLTEGRPLLVRTPESEFNAANLMRTLIYSCIATLKIGMDILLKQENVTLEKMLAHGGLFKSPITGQRFLAAALEVPVALMESAGEGGAWGIALLAAYQAREDKSEQLTDYLNSRVFANLNGSCLSPDKDDIDGFSIFMEKFKAGLAIEKCAVSLNLK